MPKEELNQYVVFKLGDEEYGVNAMDIREIARPTTITRVPKSPAFIEGVFNLRGSLAPLVNLRQRFGFEIKVMDANSRIVIAELEDRPFGMLVDAATEVLRISDEDIETTPEMVTTEISKDYLKGVGKVSDRLIILLDLNEVLSKKELEEIKVFEEKSVKELQEKNEEEETEEEEFKEKEAKAVTKKKRTRGKPKRKK